MQSHQFHDLRSITLEDQADEVMKNSREFNFTSTGIAKKIAGDTAYLAMFAKAFGKKKDMVSSFELRNAVAAYVRSLMPFASPFDAYMNGDRSALNGEQIHGFNLFMGKAKCGTCHFAPLFNGNIPPWFNKSESEIIGVPARVAWQNATIDSDSGRYRINQMQELLFAFKTPTVRNVEKTGPYMHNGVYKTLEDVVTFYHKGGGVGIGIPLIYQSLPFDSLSLNQVERKAIVAFMKSLTDKKYR
jgi:cytochrome c peroxidase